VVVLERNELDSIRNPAFQASGRTGPDSCLDCNSKPNLRAVAAPRLPLLTPLLKMLSGAGMALDWNRRAGELPCAASV